VDPKGKRLGRGLESLLGELPGDRLTEADLQEIPVHQVVPNRFQPRKEFDETALKELSDSIREQGVLQPILVRRSGDKYELVAGERRWRAARLAGKAVIPARILPLDDQKMLEVALIENTQRQDLNCIERAQAYKDLMTQFNLTQEEVSKRAGIDRSTVSNFIRLLELPPSVQTHVSRGTISMGHARALLGLEDPILQGRLCERIAQEGMSVRRLEGVIARIRTHKKSPSASTTKAQVAELEERLRRKLGTKVTIRHRHRGGSIRIEFYSNDDFSRILRIMESGSAHGGRTDP
jgi:ParB family chromosome partitioning protein